MYSVGYFFMGIWVLALLATLYWMHKRLGKLQRQADEQREIIIAGTHECSGLKVQLVECEKVADQLAASLQTKHLAMVDAHQNLEMVLESTPNWFDDIEAEIGINGITYQFRKNQKNEPVMIHFGVDTSGFDSEAQKAIEAVGAVEIYEGSKAALDAVEAVDNEDWFIASDETFKRATSTKPESKE